MRKFSKRAQTVKAVDQKILQEKLISEESLLSIAMGEFAAKVLHVAVDKIKETIVGAQSWGFEDGYVRAGLNRIPIEKPRLRAGDKEITIDEYEKLQSPSEFNEAVRRAVMGGLASRSFKKVGDALGASKGLSKSTISRVSKSFNEDFQKLMSEDLKDIKAVLIDGIYYTKELCVVAALGVSSFGGKRVLGLWAGSTENAELMKSAMTDMRDRNLNPKLFVIDGAKPLRSAIDKFFSWVPVQRCQVHKRRNIIGHVGEKNETWAHLQMTKIFKAESVDAALELGKKFREDLAALNQTAYRSWCEGFPETITILQLKDSELRRVLSTTNSIESIFSSIRLITGRVKRWRNANQALYWTAGGYFRIQPQLRKIRGFRALKELDLISKIEQQKAQQNAA